MPRDQVHVTGHVPLAPEAVWAVVRDFSGQWHPWVETVRAERDSCGAAVRAFSVRGEGGTYREVLTYFSDSDRVLAYRHLEGIAGCDAYDARLTVSVAEAGGATVTWVATVQAGPERLRAICAGTEAVFRAGIEALQTATLPLPAPRAPLPDPATVTDMAVDTLPRLALSVTPDLGDGRLCLFLHGIGGGRTNWLSQLQAAGAVMRSAALDLRGYGGSTLGPAQSTVDDYCADILRVADVLKADRLVLAGLSYGSWIATSFAMRHADRLDGLILSGGCTGMSEAGPDEREAFRISREVPLNAGQVPADFAPAVVKVLASPGASDAVRGRLLQSMSAIPAATYRDALRCFTNPLERFDFARITMPVLMMTGEHDRLAPPAEIRGVAGRIWDSAPKPDVRFEVIADAGHVCNVEAPDNYSNHLLDFLTRLR
jgi:pimeloyl-ACP methyl ester carboxylesterase